MSARFTTRRWPGNRWAVIDNETGETVNKWPDARVACEDARQRNREATR